MKVSIIIPVYNVAKYIRECVISVIKQSYNDIEMILVDDCGHDNSIEIAIQTIEEYNYSKAKIIHHNANKGLSAARNTGIKESEGDFILFLDSDDCLHKDAIKKLMDTYNKDTESDFIIGGLKTFGLKDITYPLLSKEILYTTDEIFDDYILKKWNAMACNKMIKKDFIYKNNLFFIEGVYHEDMDFSFRLALSAKRMSCCKDITYFYLIRDNSITTSKKIKNFIDFINIIKQNIGIITQRNDIKYNKTNFSNFIIELFYNMYFDIIKSNGSEFNMKSKMKILKIIKNIFAERKNLFEYSSFKYKIKKTIILNSLLFYPIAKSYISIRKL